MTDILTVYLRKLLELVEHSHVETHSRSPDRTHQLSGMINLLYWKALQIPLVRNKQIRHELRSVFGLQRAGLSESSQGFIPYRESV